jgi:hypothetical protein
MKCDIDQAYFGAQAALDGYMIYLEEGEAASPMCEETPDLIGLLTDLMVWARDVDRRTYALEFDEALEAARKQFEALNG